MGSKNRHITWVIKWASPFTGGMLNQAHNISGWHAVYPGFHTVLCAITFLCIKAGQPNKQENKTVNVYPSKECLFALPPPRPIIYRTSFMNCAHKLSFQEVSEINHLETTAALTPSYI